MKNIFSSKYTCSKCELKFGFDNMRYATDGKSLICMECCTKAAKKADKPFMSTEKKAVQQTTSDRIRVMCISCRYKFFLRKGSRVEPKCPYCGKNRLAKYEELTADRLLNEASKDRDFY